MKLSPFQERKVLEQLYFENIRQFTKFGNLIKLYLSDALQKAEIPFMEIQMRIKDFDSFLNKIKLGKAKGKYQKPFEEIEDICGVRVICVFRNHIDTICEIIASLFEASAPDDKELHLQSNEFGYRSVHTIVKVKEPICGLSVFYEDLKNLKAEIQVRTIGMHAWSEVSHKLDYKNSSVAPQNFRRELYRMSPLLETVDEGFERLYNSKKEYYEQFKDAEQEKFDLSQDINVDSLHVFLDLFFSDRKSDNSLGWKNNPDLLLDELLMFNISFEQIIEAQSRCREIVAYVEEELFRDKAEKRHTQCGIIRLFLDLTNDDFWEYRKAYLPMNHYGDERIRIIDIWKQKLI